MEMTAEKFRDEVKRRRGERRRGAAPYSPEQRAFAVAYARSGQKQGRSVAASAAALGLSDPTLREWLAEPVRQPGTALRSVVVKHRAASGASSPSQFAGLTLITPAGYRVRGLDVTSAAALLRVLG
jgi:transposase-like protein